MDNPEKLAMQSTQWEEKHNTIFVWHQYTQTNTNNVNKTWVLLQTTGGNDELNIVTMPKSSLRFYSNVDDYFTKIITSNRIKVENEQNSNTN